MQMTVDFRPAIRADVECIVKMLADDVLGAKRENAVKPLPKSYYEAFEHIVGDPNNELVVADCDGKVVGVLQLTYIPYLTYQGSWRALIEGVRVRKDYRSKGIGKKLFTWAIERATSSTLAISNASCPINTTSLDHLFKAGTRAEKSAFFPTPPAIKIM